MCNHIITRLGQTGLDMTVPGWQSITTSITSLGLCPIVVTISQNKSQIFPSPANRTITRLLPLFSLVIFLSQTWAGTEEGWDTELDPVELIRCHLIVLVGLVRMVHVDYQRAIVDIQCVGCDWQSVFSAGEIVFLSVRASTNISKAKFRLHLYWCQLTRQSCQIFT